MITVRVLLTGGHVYEVDCAADDPLLQDLARAVSRRRAGGGLLTLDVIENGRKRRVEIAHETVAAVETDPPTALPEAEYEDVIETAPYVVIPDFLSREENRRIFDYVVAHEADYGVSTVNTGETGYRNSRFLGPVTDLPVDIKARFCEIMPEVLAHLALAPLPDYFITQVVIMHNDGCFYKVHRDNATAAFAGRKLNGIYYVHREPRPFGGGGLRLYDTRFVDGERWWADSFTHLPPVNNTMVFFPTHVYHEVLPVDCASGAFADSRFTVNTVAHDATYIPPNAD